MALIKTRKIKLAQTHPDQMDAATQLLAKTKGIKEIEFAPNKKMLTVTFDLESIVLKSIENILKVHRIELDNSFPVRFRRSWQHFTEQNELDNLNVEPSCCSNPKEIVTPK